MNSVELKNVKKTLGTFTLNIDSLKIPKGYITGFIGQNGSGKTTTIKLIMDMLYPDSGDVKVFNQKLSDDPTTLKMDISYIGNYPGFPEEVTLKKIKKMIAPFYKTWDELLYKKYIKKFSLDVSKKFKDLSSGKKKQFELCIALSHKPKLLIMDEPTVNLDPIIRNEFLEILLEHLEDGEMSVFYSSHITSDLEKAADFIYFIDNGKILLTGEKDELIENHKIIKGKLSILTPELEKYFIGLTKGSFGFDALTNDFDEVFNLLGNEAIYEKATLEDLMLYYTRGI